MKEQCFTAILPELPIVGTLQLTSTDLKKLRSIEVIATAPAQGMNPYFKTCHRELHSFLSGKKKTIDLELDLSSLSTFQQSVLREMRRIPYGEVCTYKDLAQKLHSKAYQAIGSACGRNPLLLIYPCHRVVGARGLGGFAHGLEMKKELLGLEANPGWSTSNKARGDFSSR